MTAQPKICVATHHASIAELLADAEFRALAHRDGFLIELRLDFFDDLAPESLDRALDAFAPEVLVTFRHPLEGGKRPDASDTERLRFLQRAADRGVQYIDIEARTPRGDFNKRGAKLVLSYHDFEKVPDFETLLKDIHLPMATSPSVDVVKIALMPQTTEDLAAGLILMELGRDTASHGPSTLVLLMGEAGLWSRVLAGYFGAPFTFARGEGSTGTAPGQPSWRELDELYRFRDIRPDWPVYGVIGNPIGHSLSPLMHNTALKHLGLPGVYLPFKVDAEGVRFFKKSFAFGFVSGVSVTIPHKETIMECCDRIDPAAKAIGAVNTLRAISVLSAEDETAGCAPENGWEGSNTDAPAAADCLEDALGTLRGKHVLVIGAGGAARAVAVGVTERGARVSVLNRTRERAEQLARETGATAVAVEDLAALYFDAIVNTTPLGMFPNVDATPLAENQIPQGGLVFDTVYNPLRTRFLEWAEQRGCTTIEGISMFIRQGVRQFELWTGQTAPREVMHRVVLDALKKRQAKK